jgi:type I restriction enzyme S subunit
MTQQPLIDISPENWQIVSDILQRLVPKREVWAFGSRAKWSAKEYSDLDIAIIGDEPLGLARMAELTEAFQESALSFKVDVVDWATISESFRGIVERDKVEVQTRINRNDASIGFRIIPANDYCLKVADGTHDSPKQAAVGKKLITSKHLKSGKVVLDDAYLISADDFEQINKRSKVDQWDIIFSMIGTVGEMALIKEPSPDFAIKNVGLFKNRNAVDAKWLFYYLHSPQARTELERRKKGSTQQYISLGELRSFPILEPINPAYKQDVVEMLSALDDKIDQLLEINSTLEAIAQALFKSWFVDFDPVRAKAEFGEIPKGWKVKPFTETVNIIGGGTPKTSVAEYWGGNIPWFSVVDTPADGSVFVIDTEKKVTEEGVQSSSTKILPEGTTIITARGTVGKIALVGVPMAMNQSCYGLSDTDGNDYFTYFSTKSLVKSLQQRSHGSVFETITRETLASVSVVRANSSVTIAFEQQVDCLFQHVKNNLHEIAALSRMRDMLLPKLMSGQLATIE